MRLIGLQQAAGLVQPQVLRPHSDKLGGGRDGVGASVFTGGWQCHRPVSLSNENVVVHAGSSVSRLIHQI
jgi:hypothetical protein